jgi:hypothetical protein
LKEQILSARLRETPYLNFSCTGAEVVPCSLGDMMSSDPYTSGPLSSIGFPRAEAGAGSATSDATIVGSRDDAAKFARNARRLLRASLVADDGDPPSSGAEEEEEEEEEEEGRGRAMPGPRRFDEDVDGSIDRDDAGPTPDREPADPTMSLGLDLRNRVLNDSAAPTRRARMTVRKRDGIMVLTACHAHGYFPFPSDA